MIFGSSLTLLGQFCEKNFLTTDFCAKFLAKNDRFSFHTHWNTNKRLLHSSKDLHDSKYVFIRNDAVKKILCPTYSGPGSWKTPQILKTHHKRQTWYCLHRQAKTGVLRFIHKEKYGWTLYHHTKYHIVQTIFHTDKYTCKHHHKIW